jgi:hypothetical protein
MDSSLKWTILLCFHAKFSNKNQVGYPLFTDIKQSEPDRTDVAIFKEEVYVQQVLREICRVAVSDHPFSGYD